METVCETAGVKPVVPNMPTGVELLRRVNGDASWLFVLNHSFDKISVPLATNGRDLLTGMEANGFIELEPSGVAIIQA